MSKNQVTHKLLSREEIKTRILAKSAEGTFLAQSQADPVSHVDDVILHRSIYRDYFGAYMQHVGLSYGDALSDDQMQTYFQRFAERFTTGQYDFASNVRPDAIARERGWVNPLGWDTESGNIIKPLTNLFRRAATLSIDLQYFHDQALQGALPLPFYEQVMVRYIDHALKTSPGDPPIYDALIQTQAQVAETSIRLRQEFEDQQHPMSAEDWDRYSSYIQGSLKRQAAGSRIDSYKQSAMVSSGKCPFHFKEKSFSRAPVDENTVAAFTREMGLQPYVDAVTDQPVTGCPAIPAGATGIGSYVSYVVKEYVGAVRRDFWPS